MGLFKTVRVGRHNRLRASGQVERVKGHKRRPRRIRWRVVFDDLFAGLGVLVASSSGTLMRVLTITFSVLVVLGYLIVAPIAYLFGHKIGPKRRKTHGFRKDFRRKYRRRKRHTVRVVQHKLGTQQIGWTQAQRRAQRARALRG